MKHHMFMSMCESTCQDGLPQTAKLMQTVQPLWSALDFAMLTADRLGESALIQGDCKGACQIDESWRQQQQEGPIDMESVAIGLPSLCNRSSSVRHGSLCSFHGPHGGKQMHDCAWSVLRSSVQANCQRIAETAPAEGNRQRWLGILYDEVCLRASHAFSLAFGFARSVAETGPREHMLARSLTLHVKPCPSARSACSWPRACTTPKSR